MHRDTAGVILTEFTKGDSQRKHARAVEASTRAYADYSGMPRVRLLDRRLYARDEPTGFVHACALVRTACVITGMSASSVRKKLKDKGFARTANREDVYRGAVELGVGLDEHLAFIVAALDAIAPEIGLAREPT